MIDVNLFLGQRDEIKDTGEEVGFHEEVQQKLEEPNVEVGIPDILFRPGKHFQDIHETENPQHA